MTNTQFSGRFIHPDNSEAFAESFSEKMSEGHQFSTTQNSVQFKVPWGDKDYWKRQAQFMADLENHVFSYLPSHRDRKEHMRYRRGLRSAVKTRWARYVRLKEIHNELS